MFSENIVVAAPLNCGAIVKIKLVFERSLIKEIFDEQKMVTRPGQQANLAL